MTALVAFGPVNAFAQTTRQKDFWLGAVAAIGLLLVLGFLLPRAPGLWWAAVVLVVDGIGWTLFFRAGLPRRWILVGGCALPLFLGLVLFTVFWLAAGA